MRKGFLEWARRKPRPKVEQVQLPPGTRVRVDPMRNRALSSHTAFYDGQEGLVIGPGMRGDSTVVRFDKDGKEVHMKARDLVPVSESMKHEQTWDYEMAVDYLRAVGFGLDSSDGQGATLSISPQPWHPTGPTMTIHVTKQGARWTIISGGQGEGIGRDTLMDKLDSMGVYPESKKHEQVFGKVSAFKGTEADARRVVQAIRAEYIDVDVTSFPNMGEYEITPISEEDEDDVFSIVKSIMPNAELRRAPTPNLPPFE